LRFQSIAFENFISYRDRQKIDFVPSENGLVIFEGQQGHGKSNLLNAFFWCLFDELWHSDESKFIHNPDPSKLTLFNLGELKDAVQEGRDHIELFVEIEFIDGNDCYSIKREHSGNYIDKEWVYNNDSIITVAKKDGDTGETTYYVAEKAKGMIQKFFPQNIANYFLFRGENMEELAKLSGKGTFSIALTELSKLKLFERMVDHLEFTYKKARKEAADAKGGDLKKELEKLKDKEELTKKNLEAMKIVEDGLVGNFNDSEATYNECTDKINKHGEALKKQQRIERLEGEIDQLLERTDELQDRKNKNISADWSAILVKGLPELIINRHKKGVKAGEYPKPIKMSTYEETIDNCKCSLCQTDLDNTTVDMLKKFIKDQKDYDAIMSEIERLAGDGERIKSFIEQLPEKFTSTDDIIKKKNEKIATMNLEIDGIREKIGKIDENMADLTRLQKQARDDQMNIQSRLERAREDIDEYNKELLGITHDITIYEEQLGTNSLETLRLKLAKDAFEAAVNLDKSYRNDLFDKLESFTQENWEKLCYDVLTYKTIKLDRKNSYFDVLDEEENSRRASMNTGHRIILVLSFISALIRIAKENFEEEIPMVLDAPLSEIGSGARLPLLLGWPSIFGQSIFILQDKTITPEIKSKIKNDIIKMYSIKYDKERQSTIVSES
tara:strand:- start:558 stop:2567 length:2010 start_codon:yes stop_codon:yes gene_type:complete